MVGKTLAPAVAGAMISLLVAGCESPPVPTAPPHEAGRGVGAYQVLAAPSACPLPATPTPAPTPSWPPSRTDRCEPFVDPSGVGPRITAGTTTYSSTFEPLAADVFSAASTYCNRWNNGATGSATVTRTLGRFYPIRHVRIEMAIGDTTQGATSYRLALRTKAGWQDIDALTDTGIGFGFPGYRRSLSPPIEADAFRLTMTGHGWFTGYGFALYE